MAKQLSTARKFKMITGKDLFHLCYMQRLRGQPRRAPQGLSVTATPAETSL